MTPSPEPLGDAHTPSGADVPEERSKRRQYFDGMLIPLMLRQRGEPRDIDEGEAAVDSHDPNRVTQLGPGAIHREPAHRPHVSGANSAGVHIGRRWRADVSIVSARPSGVPASYAGGMSAEQEIERVVDMAVNGRGADGDAFDKIDETALHALAGLKLIAVRLDALSERIDDLDDDVELGARGPSTGGQEAEEAREEARRQGQLRRLRGTRSTSGDLSVGPGRPVDGGTPRPGAEAPAVTGPGRPASPARPRVAPADLGQAFQPLW